MENTMTKLPILAILLSLIAGLNGLAIADDTPTTQPLEHILAAQPPQTFQQEHAHCAAILQQGPDAILSLCRMLDQTENDARQRTLLQSLAVYVACNDRTPQRTLFIQAIADALNSSSNKQTQTFLIELLQWAGDDRSVKVLSPFLNDEYLCGPAARALTTLASPIPSTFQGQAQPSSQRQAQPSFQREAQPSFRGEAEESIPSPAADALTSALAHSHAADKAAVIIALGTLRAEKATDLIARHAQHPDPAIRQSALWALANLGCEPIGPTLFEQITGTAGYPQAQAGANYLLLAQRLTQKGQAHTAATLCRKLLADTTGTIPAAIKAGALDVLLTAAGPAAMDDLVAAADSPNEQLQAAAVNIAYRIEGTDATARWLALLNTAEPPLAERIVTMLGRRGDRTALPTVLERIQDKDDRVAAAAMTAAIELNQDQAIQAILAMLCTADRPQQIAEGVDVLMRLPGQQALQAAAQSLEAMPATSRIALIQGLANRRAAAFGPYLLRQAADADPAVRRAAIRALAVCAAPDDLPTLLSLMLKTQDPAEQAGLQRAVVAAANQNPDAEHRTAAILQRLSQADQTETILLVRTLGQIGGTDALKTIQPLLKSDNPDLKDAAIGALADWPDLSALDDLMQIVQTEELRCQVIALRSALRLMQNNPLPDRQKVQRAKQALQAVSRSEEKQRILSFLSQIKTLRSLTAAAGCLAEEDPSLRSAAAVAVARIALPDDTHPGLTGVYVATVLTDALNALPDETLQQQVRDYLATLPPPAEPVTKTPPDGFTALFNGKDLTGWQGVLLPPYDNPLRRAHLTDAQRAELQAQADTLMRKHWHIRDGVLFFDGQGFSLSTLEDYKDFELYVDWKIAPHGDSGIYLRGSPQVQIWDPADWPEGSGGLYNNQKNPSKPLLCADNPVGQWNTFYIRMIDHFVTVYLNDTLVVDNVILENYWDRSRPIFAAGPIELQCHGDPVWFNNIFVRRIPPHETGWTALFNGRDLTGWIGDTAGYRVQDNTLFWHGGGNLYTEKQYGDFHFKCDFRLSPGANNGIGIRAPRQGDPAYHGMEIQLLDDSAEQYADLKPYQYCGSVYGVAPAKRGHLNPVGQWNAIEIIARGPRITVILNDGVIVDTDLTDAIRNGTIDGREHPGLNSPKGHIVLLGHGSEVAFRNLQIREL